MQSWTEPSCYSELATKFEQSLVTEPEMAHAMMAEACRTDLYFLLRYGLRREDCANRWVYERCQEDQASPESHKDQRAHEHNKTTNNTNALTIQNILCDPEITIGIFSHTR